MNLFSKALVAVTLFTAVASAAQAQNPYFGTTFDGVVDNKYNDGGTYVSGPDGTELNGQNGWTVTSLGSGFVADVGTLPCPTIKASCFPGRTRWHLTG